MQFVIDGENFDVVVSEIRRKFTISKTGAGGTLLSGRKKSDVNGTYLSYEMDIPTDRLSPTDYDRLVEVLAAPVESHTITMPYGQTEVTIEAEISSVEDSTTYARKGVAVWKGLSVAFDSKDLYRRPE